MNGSAESSGVDGQRLIFWFEVGQGAQQCGDLVNLQAKSLLLTLLRTEMGVALKRLKAVMLQNIHTASQITSPGGEK
jgi:hypothetical protein